MNVEGVASTSSSMYDETALDPEGSKLIKHCQKETSNYQNRGLSEIAVCRRSKKINIAGDNKKLTSYFENTSISTNNGKTKFNALSPKLRNIDDGKANNTYDGDLRQKSNNLLHCNSETSILDGSPSHKTLSNIFSFHINKKDHFKTGIFNYLYMIIKNIFQNHSFFVYVSAFIITILIIISCSLTLSHGPPKIFQKVVVGGRDVESSPINEYLTNRKTKYS
uniref:Uncharacterized protein n=1 Tax=Strongyloides venezuelensis TaxID=75913 RepID=A0A0K0FX58_STRVS